MLSVTIVGILSGIFIGRRMKVLSLVPLHVFVLGLAAACIASGFVSAYLAIEDCILWSISTQVTYMVVAFCGFRRQRSMMSVAAE